MQHAGQADEPAHREPNAGSTTEREKQAEEHSPQIPTDGTVDTPRSVLTTPSPKPTPGAVTAVKPASVPSQPLPALSSPHGTTPLSDVAAAELEQAHVHAIYSQIAPHFSSTRYKPWPVVSTFLLSLPAGSVGLDVGCGNGKYLSVNPSLYIMGSDFSAALVRIARDHGGERRGEVCVADGLALPYKTGGVDFVICVAVLHHLSTRARRREGVRRLLECVRRRRMEKDEGDRGGGRVLMYVWALEQRGSRRGWDEGAEQDRLVPWVMKSNTGRSGKSKSKSKEVTNEKENRGEEEEEAGEDGANSGNDKTYQRYYHLYRKGELEEDVEAVGGRVLESGYDRDNWWVVACRGSS